MNEALKSDDIVEKVGGRFKFTALIQRRIAELINGARPLVDRDWNREVVSDEISRGSLAEKQHSGLSC
ncbi:MAG: DNA-directed RNA polymerase subunit omega [Planctomycetes bacterium]|nr:DNA-directed RNA polymerase subunit omega [Planctomycetota bacterium]